MSVFISMESGLAECDVTSAVHFTHARHTIGAHYSSTVSPSHTHTHTQHLPHTHTHTAPNLPIVSALEIGGRIALAAWSGRTKVDDLDSKGLSNGVHQHDVFWLQVCMN